MCFLFFAPLLLQADSLTEPVKPSLLHFLYAFWSLFWLPSCTVATVMHDTLCSKGYIHHMKRLLEHNETVFIVFHQQKLV